MPFNAGDIKTDPVTEELFLTNGDLTLLTGTEATQYDCLRRLNFFMGEWFLDVQGVGFPWIQRVFGQKAPDLGEIRRLFVAKILETPHIISVPQCDLHLSSSRVLTGSFTALTDDNQPVGGVINEATGQVVPAP